MSIERRNEMNTKTNNTNRENQTCEKCGKGTYTFKTMQDEYQKSGSRFVTCTKCGDRKNAQPEYDEKK